MPRHYAAFDDVGFEVEVFDFCGNFGRALRNIAERHRTEAVMTIDERVPEGIASRPDGGDRPDAGDDRRRDRHPASVASGFSRTKDLTASRPRPRR